MNEWPCVCGASNPGAQLFCEQCGSTAASPNMPLPGTSPDPAGCGTCAAILEKRKAYRPGDMTWPAHHCFRCGTHDASVQSFHVDTPDTKDRQTRLCSSCWVPALRRRSTCAHAWAEGLRDGAKCERCAFQIQGDRELFREYMRQIEARTVTL